MKTKLLIFVWLALIAQSTFSQKRPPRPIAVVRAAPFEMGKPGAWQETVSEAGGFRVEFPGIPMSPPKFADATFVPAPINSGSYSLQTASVYYHLNFSDYAYNGAEAEKLKAVYDRKRESYLDGTSLKLASETDVFLDKHLGRERVTTDDAGTTVTKTRLFLIGGTFYELSATAAKSVLQREQANIDRFLNSFRLTEAPPKKPAMPNLEAAWREFAVAKSEFKIAFPGKPTEREMPSAKNEKIKAAYYSTRNAGAEFAVVVSSYPYVVQDLETLNLAYENLRAYFSELPNQKLQSFNETASGKYPGREFIVTNSKEELLLRGRVFVVGQRVYQLIVAAPSEEISSQANEFYAKAAERFFASFQITGSTLSVAEAAALPIPANIKGEIDDEDVYRNDFFDFTMKLPSDWQVLNRDEVGLAQEAGRSVFGSPDARKNSALLAAQKRVLNLLAISKLPMGLPENSMIMIAAEKSVDPKGTATEAALLNEKTIAEKNTVAINIVRPTFATKIGGADFAGFEYELEMYGVRVQQQMLFTKRGGYDLIFAFAYSKKDDQKTLAAAMQSLKFETKKQ